RLRFGLLEPLAERRGFLVGLLDLRHRPVRVERFRVGRLGVGIGGLGVGHDAVLSRSAARCACFAADASLSDAGAVPSRKSSPCVAALWASTTITPAGPSGTPAAMSAWW